MADLEHGVPITPKTMFYMASVSKQFTAMTVLMLAKENKLSLDDSVRKYVPELPRYADKITLRELLTHTSGIRDYMTLGELSGLSDDNTYSEAEVLQQLSRQEGLNFPPGSAMLYSNSGYVLLSIIVKRVTGKPLSEVSRASIFNPLGMTASLFQHDHSMLVPNKAFGYELRQGAWHAANNMLDHVGDGGLYSSVDDMFHWMGNFDAPKVGADVLSVMETPATLSDGKKAEYGMGLTLSRYRGLNVVEHNGGYAGYRTEDIWFPSERLSVVVLCNLGAVNPVQLARTISDLYFQDRGQLGPALGAAGGQGRRRGRSEAPRRLRRRLRGSARFHHVIHPGQGPPRHANDRPETSADVRRVGHGLSPAGAAGRSRLRQPVRRRPRARRGLAPERRGGSHETDRHHEAFVGSARGLFGQVL